MTLAAVAYGLAAGGCATTGRPSDDPCARAVDRLEMDCGFTVDGVDAGTQFNCSGQAGCAAECLVSTPCEDIKKNTKVFEDCLDACKTQ